MSDTKLVGKVKWFNKLGFGFLTICSEGPLNGKEVFVHYSQLQTPNENDHRYLMQGEYVEFVYSKMEDNDKKYEYHATNVTGIYGGDLMCMSRVNLQKPREQTEEGFTVVKRKTGGVRTPK